MKKNVIKGVFLLLFSLLLISGMRTNSYAASTNPRWKALKEKYLNDTKTPQLLFIKYQGGSRAKAILYTKENNKWKKVFACSAEVGRNGIDKVREGDKRTPTGVFNLTKAFGIKKNPGSKVKYVKINKYLYWCGEKNYYNKLIDIRKKPHNCYNGEHLIDYAPCYDYGMFLDFNKKCIYKKGAAIFLHCKGNSGYTAGCIAVSRSNMIRIIQTVEKGAKICIFPA